MEQDSCLRYTPSMKQTRKVALVHDFLLTMGGAERVVKVLADLYPDAPIYTLLYDEAKCGAAFPKERVRASFLQKLPTVIRRRYQMLFPLMPRAIESFDLSEYDLVISSSGAFSHGVLTASNATHISYCHSPMRYAWDYTHQYARDRNFTGLQKFLAGRILHGVRFWDSVAADRPDVYLANSVHVQKRIHKYYRLPSEVLYPPVDTEKFSVAASAPRGESALPAGQPPPRGVAIKSQKSSPKKSDPSAYDDYFLMVATLTPYKKIDLAVALFNALGRNLVIIGGGPQLQYLRTVAGPTVHVLGRRSDDDVVGFLQRQRGFIMVNEEDFGIAPIEAMACGKPVLAYGRGGVMETVVPGVTGEFFYEQTLASLEDGLGRLIVNEQNYDAAKIRRHAQKFSQQEFVKNWKRVVTGR